MNTFSALADPTRLQIFELIARGEKSVNEIVQRFPFKTPTISQHLRVLRNAHLVLVRAEGKHRYYAVDQQGLQEIEQWTTQMAKQWETHLDALEAVLQEQQGAHRGK